MARMAHCLCHEHQYIRWEKLPLTSRVPCVASVLFTVQHLRQGSDVSSEKQTPNDHGDVDPYVEVALYDPAKNETERQETSKQVNEPDPKFGDKFDFIMASATSVLNITVYDTLGWMEGRLSLKGLTGDISKSVALVYDSMPWFDWCVCCF